MLTLGIDSSTQGTKAVVYDAAGGLVAAEAAPFASMRVQAQCMATGQAAGVAAAFRPDEDVRRLDFAAVRRLCETQGAITQTT